MGAQVACRPEKGNNHWLRIRCHSTDEGTDHSEMSD